MSLVTQIVTVVTRIGTEFKSVRAAIAASQGALVGVNNQTGSYTLALSDAGKIVIESSSTAATLTIPTNASVNFPVGSVINLATTGTGALTIAAASGVVINSPSGLRMTTQYAQASLIKVASDTWMLSGQTVV